MRIGEVLLKQGVVAPPQLQRALAEQRVAGGSLEQALIGLGLVTEATLAQSLATAAGVPLFEGEVRQAPPAAAALVPEQFARQHHLCPVSLEGNLLQVVQSNPFDVLAIEDLRQCSGHDVQQACGPRTCVDGLIAATYCAPTAGTSSQPADLQAESAVTSETVRTVVGPVQEARRLDDLGLGRKSAAHVRELLLRSQGLIVVTGPCGAGKNTTVHAALSLLRGRVKNIVTTEKPAETGDAERRATGAEAPDRFAAAVRGLLPQDPDVIAIGDMSTPETADLAVRAALSGVLVFGTLDIGDAAAVADCLVDMGLDAPRVASALIGVVSQRLVRVVCCDCRQEATYSEGILAKAGLEAADGIKFYRGRGCDHCAQSGFRGRTGVFEVLRIDPEIQELIRARADADAIRTAALRRGMRTQFDDVMAKALFGSTTFEEALKIAGARARRGRGHQT
jgi:type II secretory ATPase GspE/PulE/Tfp pilus assembly ATPase PilB-like protein